MLVKSYAFGEADHRPLERIEEALISLAGQGAQFNEVRSNDTIVTIQLYAIAYGRFKWGDSTLDDVVPRILTPILGISGDSMSSCCAAVTQRPTGFETCNVP